MAIEDRPPPAHSRAPAFNGRTATMLLLEGEHQAGRKNPLPALGLGLAPLSGPLPRLIAVQGCRHVVKEIIHLTLVVSGAELGGSEAGLNNTLGA